MRPIVPPASLANALAFFGPSLDVPSPSVATVIHSTCTLSAFGHGIALSAAVFPFVRICRTFRASVIPLDQRRYRDLNARQGSDSPN